MKIFNIKIYSVGGQGVRSLVKKMQDDFNNLESTSLTVYDSVIKNGAVVSFLRFSDKKIVSPFFDNIDLCIVLDKGVKSFCKEKNFVNIDNFNRNNNSVLEKNVSDVLKKFFDF